PSLRPEHLVPTLTHTHLLPFPLGEPATRCRRFYLCRAAIVQGLRAFQLAPGSVALMPAYHHGIEVEAVRAAGLTVRFYRIDRSLQVDLDDVERRLGDRAVRVLYVTHFAGFPAPIEELRALASQRGILVIEDCALALLSRAPDGTP